MSAIIGANELKRRRPYLEELIHKHFPDNRDSVVLDLGCGSGALLHLAVEQGYTNVKSVDRSPQQVGLARKQGIANVEYGDPLETLERLPI